LTLEVAGDEKSQPGRLIGAVTREVIRNGENEPTMNELNRKTGRRAAMDQEQPIPALRLVIPLPIALYSSHGLLFELYEGGQPWRLHHIVWERLKPIEEQTSTRSPASSIAKQTRD
jgi:hypothetical protein